LWNVQYILLLHHRSDSMLLRVALGLLWGHLDYGNERSRNRARSISLLRLAYCRGDLANAALVFQCFFAKSYPKACFSIAFLMIFTNVSFSLGDALQAKKHFKYHQKSHMFSLKIWWKIYKNSARIWTSIFYLFWHPFSKILGASGDPFGHLGGAFGRPWAVSGVSCALSGRIFGPSWSLLGPPWLYFGRFWSLQGHFGLLQASFWSLWGPLLEPIGQKINHLARTKKLQTINENLSSRTDQKCSKRTYLQSMQPSSQTII